MTLKCFIWNIFEEWCEREREEGRGRERENTLSGSLIWLDSQPPSLSVTSWFLIPALLSVNLSQEERKTFSLSGFRSFQPKLPPPGSRREPAQRSSKGWLGSHSHVSNRTFNMRPQPCLGLSQQLSKGPFPRAARNFSSSGETRESEGSWARHTWRPSGSRIFPRSDF